MNENAAIITAFISLVIAFISLGVSIYGVYFKVEHYEFVEVTKMIDDEARHISKVEGLLRDENTVIELENRTCVEIGTIGENILFTFFEKLDYARQILDNANDARFVGDYGRAKSLVREAHRVSETVEDRIVVRPWAFYASIAAIIAIILAAIAVLRRRVGSSGRLSSHRSPVKSQVSIFIK